MTSWNGGHMPVMVKDVSVRMGPCYFWCCPSVEDLPCHCACRPSSATGEGGQYLSYTSYWFTGSGGKQHCILSTQYCTPQGLVHNYCSLYHSQSEACEHSCLCY
uniref:Uncharacterized protein n=1 Tax=Eutreptiella gymnastica TaxID=73025 RepID=A0A7S4CVV8_9EUGL|mmetsp:Transcript_68192/g.114641  ORF Transcript_68192/g.114641 Transcript_68192/m.114641 type:complete len:104 (-) Transcript_68192:9-320(-)